MQVMKGAYLVLATSERNQHVFLVKLGSSQKSKASKVKKSDSVITLSVKQHEIVATQIVDDRNVMTIQGTAFTLSRHVSPLFSEENAIQKEISIDAAGAQEQAAGSTQKQNTENYNVVEMDQSRQINPQFQMFNLDELKIAQDSSSRKTSASTG